MNNKEIKIIKKCRLKEITTDSRISKGHHSHRMVNTGRDFWRSSCWILQTKQDHSEADAKEYVQTAFEYLRYAPEHFLAEQGS